MTIKDGKFVSVDYAAESVRQTLTNLAFVNSLKKAIGGLIVEYRLVMRDPAHSIKCLHDIGVEHNSVILLA